MKAVTWHAIGDIRWEDVPDPRISQPYDAIVRITASAICGTDLHFVRGTMPGMREGRVLGHEAVGVVEEVGPGVRNLRAGDRVVAASTVACGFCAYCRAGCYAQCDNANPGGPLAGTVFFGGPEAAGGLDGFQAEYARVPYAHVGLVPLPDTVDDGQAVLLSDIYPTAWFGGRLAEVGAGDTVAILGGGPVGQAAVACARLQGAGRVLLVDGLDDRLDLARRQHAETVNFNEEDPVEAIRELTGGIGVDRVIDAVGVDAQHPAHGPAAVSEEERAQFERESRQAAPERRPDGDTWVPGNAPSQAARWAVQAVAKAGTIGTVGVYPPQVTSYPFGEAFMKNLTLRTGNCHHRRYLPELVSLVATGALDPGPLITQWPDTADVIDAYASFDRRESGWTKVALDFGGEGGMPHGFGRTAGSGAATTAGS
ncbi:Threonine dehydrogenase [Actinacidiphila alni]|uniref:Threonine dehydrogenase n=1 Tax=Actinacidiphila alni TaxID=380248 RepID=A0A1I2K341_9ACTN|nr:zinc-dependent alcohol dehydrogenase [Actinacidiphila alni]SFF59451.1 Threonine dehydrogenase [Actinacidiphila alni]